MPDTTLALQHETGTETEQDTSSHIADESFDESSLALALEQASASAGETPDGENPLLGDFRQAFDELSRLEAVAPTLEEPGNPIEDVKILLVSLEDRIYGDESATYKTIQDADARIRDPSDFSMTQRSIPRGTVCRVEETRTIGRRTCHLVRYAIAGGSYTAWTSTGNFNSGSSEEDVERAREISKARGRKAHIIKKTPLFDLNPRTNSDGLERHDSVIYEVPAGSLGDMEGVLQDPGGRQQPLAKVSLFIAGARKHGLVPLAALEGQGPISLDRYKQLFEERMAYLSGASGDYTSTEIAGAVSGAEQLDDGSTVHVRERARAGAQTTRSLDFSAAHRLYQPKLQENKALIEPLIERRLAQTVQQQAFVAPGQQGHRQGVQEVEALKTTLINAYGATFYTEGYAREVFAYWDILLTRELGLLENRRFLHTENGARLLREKLEWMVAATGQVETFASKSREQLANRTLQVRDFAAPQSAREPRDLTQLSDFVLDLAPHVQMFSAIPLSVISPEQNGSTQEVLVSMVDLRDEMPTVSLRSESMEAQGLEWAQDWEDLESEDGGPVGYLTVCNTAGLVELAPPLYADLGGGPIVERTMLGQRLPWTGTVQVLRREPWAEVLFGDEGQTAWIQARYTNAHRVSAEARQLQADQEARRASALDITSEAEDKQPFVAPPVGLRARGYLLLRDPSSAPALFADPISTTPGGQLSAAPWTLLTETGAPDPRRAEVLHEGAPKYIDRALVRPAEPADLAINASSLSPEDVQTIRQQLASASPFTEEPARCAAYYRRLLDVAPLATGEDTAAGGDRQARSALAEALASLQLAAPFPGASLPDAIERLRLERGLGTGDVVPLASALGASCSTETGLALLSALARGRAVLIAQGDSWGRVCRVNDDMSVVLRVGNAEQTIPAEALGTTAGVVLSVPAEIDGDPEKIAAHQQAALGERSTEAIREDYIRNIAAQTTGENDWYLQQLAQDPETAALAQALSAWVPSEAEVVHLLSADSRRLQELLVRILGPEAPAGEDRLPDSFADAVSFINAFHAAAGPDNADGTERLRERLQEWLLGVFRLTAQTLDFHLDAILSMLETTSVGGAPLSVKPLQDLLRNIASGFEGEAVIDGMAAKANNFSLFYSSEQEAQMAAHVTLSRLISLCEFGEDYGIMNVFDMTEPVQTLFFAMLRFRQEDRAADANEIAEYLLELEQAIEYDREGIAPTVAEMDNVSLAPEGEGAGPVTYAFTTEGRDADQLFYQVIASTPKATPEGGGEAVALTVGKFYTLLEADEEQNGRQTLVVQDPDDDKKYTIVEGHENDFSGYLRAHGNDPIFDLTYATTRADNAELTEEGLFKRDKNYRNNAGLSFHQEEAGVQLRWEFRKARAVVFWHQGELVVQTDDGAMRMDGSRIQSEALAATQNALDWSVERYTLAKSAGQWFLLLGRAADMVEDSREVLPVAPAAVEQILKSQQAQQDAMMERHASEISEDQQELLREADDFIKDSAAWQDYASFTVSSDFRSADGENLNADLVSRLQLMFKFFQHSGLCSRGSKPLVTSGIRSRADAHQKSTKYTIHHNASPPEGFMEALREIKGTDADQNQWVTPEDLAAKSDDEIWAQLKSEYGGQQVDPASEGYPPGSTERRPNTVRNVSNHCGGEALDIHFPLVVPTFDPIVDLVGMKFGLVRPVINTEDWHWERLGANVPYVGDEM